MAHGGKIGTTETRMNAPQTQPASSGTLVATYSTIPSENSASIMTHASPKNGDCGRWKNILDEVMESINDAMSKGNGKYLHLGVDLVGYAQRWEAQKYGKQLLLETDQPREWVLVEKSKFVENSESTKEMTEVQNLRQESKTLQKQGKSSKPESRPETAALFREKQNNPIRKSRPKSSFPRGGHGNVSEEYIAALEKDREDKATLERQKEHLEAKVATLTDNLSSLMNKAMYRDETDLENISIKSRPMKIKEEYDIFCAQQWLDAKRSIDTRLEWDEHKKLSLLNDFILDSYNLALRTYNSQQRLLMELLKSPYKATQQPERTEEHSSKEASSEVDMESAIKDGNWTPELNMAVSKYLKLNWANVDHDKMAKDLLSAHSSKETLQGSQRLQNFIKAICQISWQMVIQNPQMLFNRKDLNEPFDKDKHELHWGSCPETTGARIVCYVYPALVHGQRVLTKAKVILQKQQLS